MKWRTLFTADRGTIERRSGDITPNIDRFARGEPLENVVTTT